LGVKFFVVGYYLQQPTERTAERTRRTGQLERTRFTAHAARLRTLQPTERTRCIGQLERTAETAERSGWHVASQ